jgi:hypothetical protein
MANEKGEWIFPDSVQCKTIMISCAGYHSITTFLATNTVVLSPFVVSLGEVEIGGKEKELNIDNVEKINCSYMFNPENFSVTYGSYISNPVGKSGWLKELSFHVSTVHPPDLDVPVRIRFFEWDADKLMPGKEISTRNFIIMPKKKHWNKIDISDLKQEIPANGIVVAFELISIGPEHYHTYTYMDMNKKKQTGRYYGWHLTASCCTDCEVQGFTFSNEKWRLWYNKTKANKWAPAVKLKMKYYN